MIIHGKVIYPGVVEGEAVKCEKPVVILGDVDAKKGTVEGCGKVKDKILVFPRGAGSTVGSYTIYALRYYNTAPAGIIVENAEPIVVAGSIIAEIPTVDSIDISLIKPGMLVKIEKDRVIIPD